MQIDIVQAKKLLSRLIKSVQQGEDVVIANRGEPLARLVPVGRSPVAPGRTGQGRAILDWLRLHPLPAYAQRSAEEIDAVIVDEKGSWG